jgi:hypothetical protein
LVRSLLIFAGALVFFCGPALFAKDSAALVYAKISDLRPGQSEFGRKEVEIKLNHFLSHFGLDLPAYRRLRRDSPNGKKMKEILSSAHFENFLSVRSIEVIRDPMGEFHIIDGHHLALALRKLDVEWTEVEVYKDFLPESTKLTPNELTAAMKKFDAYMKENHFVRLVDADGKALSLSELPDTVDGLTNDPFRALAWLLKKAGLYNDKNIPFQEFEWAAFLRAGFIERGWKTEFSSDEEFMTAVNRALEIADESGGDAHDLPGGDDMPSKLKPVRKACEQLLTNFSL